MTVQAGDERWTDAHFETDFGSGPAESAADATTSGPAREGPPVPSLSLQDIDAAINREMDDLKVRISRNRDSRLVLNTGVSYCRCVYLCWRLCRANGCMAMNLTCMQASQSAVDEKGESGEASILSAPETGPGQSRSALTTLIDALIYISFSVSFHGNIGLQAWEDGSCAQVTKAVWGDSQTRTGQHPSPSVLLIATTDKDCLCAISCQLLRSASVPLPVTVLPSTGGF